VNNDVLAIIPARGGSKGLPRKNVLPVAGLPLIAWTIMAAKAARTVSRVVVSTDDAEIAAVAKRYGAEVAHRPADISGDTASSESALLHVLGHLKEHEQYEPAITAFLQCTSPLTIGEDIDGVVSALRDRNADSALAVRDFHYFIWNVADDGEATGINHDKRTRPRRQDREPQWLETGAVYAMRTSGFLQAKHRFFGKTVTHAMPPERCMEIDDATDLRIAEAMLRARQGDDRLALLPRKIDAVIFDFDGVFTDNGVVVMQDGREAVVCSRFDGMGLTRLKKTGMPMLVLSTEANPVVTARCAKLGLECLQNSPDKVVDLTRWLADRQIDAANVVYIGNDVNDAGPLQMAGCGVVVADAHPDVMPLARIVLSNVGGRGAVRELCDLIMKGMTR
jgi:YrbI family 3-deoxy-D-manno-octulosonate 8-phosphate phosphatase